MSNSQVFIASPSPYSGLLWNGATLVFKARSLWKTYLLGKTYLNPDNFLYLAGGHLIDFIAGDNQLVQIPALTILAGSRFLDFFEQENELIESWRSWHRTIFSKDPVHQYSLKSFMKGLWARIEQIAIRAFQLIWDAFQLVMRAMDIMEFITLDASGIAELKRKSVREIGIHGSRCLQAFVHQKEAFLQHLDNNKDVINDFFKSMGAQHLTHEKISIMTREMFDKLENLSGGIQEVSLATGNHIRTFLLKAAYDLSPENCKQYIEPHLERDVQEVF